MAIGHFMMAFEPLFLLALHGAHPRQRRVQAEHLDAGRHALRAGRSAPRPRVLDLLRRHQSRRVPRAAGLRHARRRARLALRLRRRRRRHDARASSIYLYAARTLPPDERSTARSPPATPQPFGRDEWRAIGALVLLVAAGDVLLGDLRAAGQHHRALGRRQHRPQRQPAGLVRANPGHLVPGLQSVHDLRLHAVHPGAVARQAERGREPSTVTKMAYGCFGVAAANLDHVRRGAPWPAAARRAGSGCSPISSSHHRRALPVADLAFAGHQGGAGPRGVDDDGRVARHELHRQLRSPAISAASGRAWRRVDSS